MVKRRGKGGLTCAKRTKIAKGRSKGAQMNVPKMTNIYPDISVAVQNSKMQKVDQSNYSACVKHSEPKMIMLHWFYCNTLQRILHCPFFLLLPILICIATVN